MGRSFLVFGAFAVAVLFIAASLDDDVWRKKLAATNDPAQVVALLLHEARAASTVDRVDSRVVIKYSLAPWALTVASVKRTFNHHVMAIVPEMFRRFSDVQMIELRATGPFRDLRGNSSEQEALRMTFSRANAASVRWDKVNPENLPKIADQYWQHPGLKD